MIRIFTDGGCKPNPGRGGWASVVTVMHEGAKGCLSGSADYTTNNRMEIFAAMGSLRWLDGNRDVEWVKNALSKSDNKVQIRSDSKYLINGVTNWVYLWKDRDWKLMSGEEVSNKDLWVQVYELLQRTSDIDIQWKHVRSHTGHKYNEMAHSIATMERDGVL